MVNECAFIWRCVSLVPLMESIQSLSETSLQMELAFLVNNELHLDDNTYFSLFEIKYHVFQW